MNSGCYGHNISESVVSIEALTFKGELKSFNSDKVKFFYRGSDFGEDLIILSVKLKGNRQKKEKHQNNKQSKWFLYVCLVR